MQKIVFDRGPGPYSSNDWIATFANYDGASDTPRELRLIGYGRTREQAEDDLILEWEDAQ